MRNRIGWLTAVMTAGLALSASDARADADPALGYVYGSYALPWRVATSASKPSFTDGEWTTSKHIGSRTGPQAYTLDTLAVGVGIGYDGFNAQLDLRSLGDVNNGSLTFGYRLNIQLGNLELWTRVAAGPAVVLDYTDKSIDRDVAGGILTIAELGLDYFFWKETMALGVKGVATPHYTWQATFAADFDVSLGLRLIL